MCRGCVIERRKRQTDAIFAEYVARFHVQENKRGRYPQRKGDFRRLGSGWNVRFRVGGGRRISFHIDTIDEFEARAEAAKLAAMRDDELIRMYEQGQLTRSCPVSPNSDLFGDAQTIPLFGVLVSANELAELIGMRGLELKEWAERSAARLKRVGDRVRELKRKNKSATSKGAG
jgi:hypothetical protein